MGLLPVLLLAFSSMGTINLLVKTKKSGKFWEP
jgi:hypothetical protein